MSAPQWSAMDDETHDLLALVADTYTEPARDANAIFLDACRRDAMANDGFVSANRVRVLVGDQIESHRYSAMWSHHTGEGRAMKVAGYETCEGSKSGNNGKPYLRRRWQGLAT